MQYDPSSEQPGSALEARPGTLAGVPGASAFPAGLEHRLLGSITLDHPERARALVFSLFDGVAATVMIALTETFGVAAAVSLEAPTMGIAVLGSAPLLLGSLGQYFMPALFDYRRFRKWLVLRGVALQIAFLVVAAAAGFAPRPWAPLIYVGAFVLAGVSANVTGAAWTSWMGDLVPPRIRGRHFAWRSRIFACVNLVCALTVGLYAARYTSRNTPWSFFGVVFVSAAIARLVSYQMLLRQHEPPATSMATTSWRPATTPRFRRFCVSNGFVQAASAMSGPFFAVWFLRDLHFNYLALSIAACCTIVGNIVSLPLWGLFADRFGTNRALRVASLLVCTVPLPYCFTSDFRVVWLLNLYSGVCWAGFNLGTFNQVLNASENRDRTMVIAYASAVTGPLVFLMTLAGGWLATHLPVLFEHRLQSLFLLSGCLRLIAAMFIPNLDVAPQPLLATETYNAVPGYRAGLGLLRNFFRAVRE